MEAAIWWRRIDRPLVAAAGSLLLAGIVLSFAASPPLAERNGLDSFHFVVRHAAYAVLAGWAMLLVSAANLRHLRRGGVLLAVAAGIAVLLLPAFGTDFGKGSWRWYSLGFVSVQPVEFLKVGFALTIAWFLAGTLNGSATPGRGAPGAGRVARPAPPGKTIAFVVALAAGVMMMALKDYGQAVLLLGTWGILYFLAGANLLMIGLLVPVVAVGAVLVYHLSPHVASRIDPFLTGTTVPHTQLDFVERALRQAELFGGGVNAGTVKNHLPDAHTDFVFAVAAEEFGLVFAGGLLLLYAFVCLRAFWLLRNAPDPFVLLAGAAVSTLLALQTLIHLGVNLRLAPAKGMTLPFLSYGGSSMLATGIAFGVLLALTRRPATGRKHPARGGTRARAVAA